ncbi:ubiquitin interaction motif-containing protein [Striga hermonthica]|uniref:Ubiquitin interaction motif-containing protein n=1 Tax=Striga hermonthica TaxID=68872 RepID=A0A9N7R471_STRHE|nr:ubiquitin interaction motif-containing protein [Striga hermonthica]
MSMVDQEADDLKMALKLSMQDRESPELKKGESREGFVGAEGVAPPVEEELTEVESRRRQRELMAAAAEKRMAEVKSVWSSKNAENQGLEGVVEGAENSGKSEVELSMAEAEKLFQIIFGDRVCENVLGQWSNQGIRFSDDPETSMGLVQHEGGPCGVLAAIQGFVLKDLLYSLEESKNPVPNDLSNMATTKLSKNDSIGADIFSSLSEEKKSRALVRSMSDVLFLCGSNEAAAVACLNIPLSEFSEAANGPSDEVISKALEGVSVETGSDLQNILRVYTCTSRSSLIQKLEELLPVFRSRMGALLFLISALLSRGLDAVREDMDDPTQPLVTAPFGHASQEIVNLLLSGKAVANVFDGSIDLGGGMFVKGISTPVEVGFLTLLESLNYCKVGQNLKCPNRPIWVVGSESHYTVLFAPDSRVQDENELEQRESEIRRAFDSQDQSGGGGFVSSEGFRHIISGRGIRFPPEKVESLCSSDFVVWSDFWQALLELDRSLGGMKDDSAGSTGEKVFDLYHFNGIAKSVVGGGGNEAGPFQRPTLVKVRVSVPPRWAPEELVVAGPRGPDVDDLNVIDNSIRLAKGPTAAPEPVAQHGPLVDCIRTRWPRAVCSWEGDAPSIV